VEPKHNSNIVKRFFVSCFTVLLSMARNAAVMLNIPPNMLMEIGLRTSI
jgi:type III secretory pathway component EscR